MAMASNERGQSVQAVSVSEEGSFVVDEEAVRRVVTRAETRGLPVAVVAVAGATRGGKSFLLDFLLRYLHASTEARNDGSWLGADDEPLRGFSWRGGCERDTNGILIWSEPIVVTLESGEKVAVLLMDTQGTFDTQTTIRESTTIFALSTLLSSTQVYNLSQNIKEDDLEYLQFFAEYGKMASGGDGDERPFQVLQFLVRDWSYAYQHPIGPIGGQNLLDVRLKEENCKTELKEIRQQIKASFECVRCFLMPHPGLEVATSPVFNGCLADITREFKSALLELTSLLLHPNNLVLKKINGQRVLTEDLLEYLKTYVDVFNSDELPTPVNILKATGEASLEVTAMSARNAYKELMQPATRAHPAPRARAAVPALHAAALQLATDTFTTRRMFITPERQQHRLQQLLSELEDNLPHYVSMNEEKLRALFAECEAIYEQNLEHSLCLTPIEVVRVHREAVDSAIDRFEEVLCADHGQGIDEDITPFKQKLKGNLSNYEAENANRIRDLIIESKCLYEEVLLGSGNDSSLVCVSPSRLGRRDREARRDVEYYFVAHFTSELNANNQQRDELFQYIERRWSEISMLNASNNSAAVTRAIEFYNDIMDEIFSDSKCLHPSDLESHHAELRPRAITIFNEARESDEEEDYYTYELETDLEIEYKRIEELNLNRNEKAVAKAHELYKRLMNITEGFIATAYTLALLDGANLAQHEEIKRDVMNVFHMEYRRDYHIDHDLDVHHNKLNALIEKSYRWQIFKMAGALSIHLTLTPLSSPSSFSLARTLFRLFKK